MTSTSVLFALCLWLSRGVFVDSEEVKSVSVMEGHSVTLHTNLTDIQTNDQILWMFGPQETRIAEIYKQIISIYDIDNDKFKGRLQLNSQTGSLTITNINITDSGLYKLLIITERGTSYKTFSVTVYAHLSVPVISRDSSQCSSSSERSSISSCVLLCSVLNVSHVTLSWYKGNSLLSSISVSDLNIRLSLPLEVEYQDTNTYSCVLNNPITNHTTHLNITDVCKSCSALLQSPHYGKIVVGLVIALMATAAVGVMCFLYRNSRRTRQEVQTHEEEEMHYADPTFCARRNESPKADEHTVYSCVVR